MVRVGGMTLRLHARARRWASRISDMRLGGKPLEPAGATRSPAGRRWPRARSGEPIWDVVRRT